MTPARQRFSARFALAVFIVASLGWLTRLDYANKISTNVLDLIPHGSRSPELGLVRALADDLQARVLLLAVRDPASPAIPPVQAARALADKLARSPAFAEATVLGGNKDAGRLGRELFDRRFSLLLPSWLGEKRREFLRDGRRGESFSHWLAEQSASNLQSFLARPEATAFQDLVPADPLLLLPGIIERAQSVEAPGGHAGGYALVWARIDASPFSAAGQGPVFAAVDRAFSEVRAEHPGLELRWTGVDRFAAASRAQIEKEIKLLNFFSIAAVLAVGCLLVRKVWKMVHLVPVILCALLGAWTVSTALFDRLDILVVVIGSLLSGVAVDYGFYIYMQPSLRLDEAYADKLRRLAKPLLASCLTTVMGFSLLLFSDLPIIRQVGAFVAAGLVCALAAAMLYFGQLRHPYLEGRRFRLEIGRQAGSRGPPALRTALVAAAVVALCGPWKLRWRDDIRELEIPAPALQANDQVLRRLFGETSDRSIYLTYGPSVAQARRNLADFLAYESKAVPNARSGSLGLIFPTEEDWRALPGRLAMLDGFEGDFRAALDRRGFLPSAFAPFFAAWENARGHPPFGEYADLYSEVGKTLSGPLAQLYQASGPLSWFLTVVETPGGADPPSVLHTINLDQLQNLDHLFAQYRESALHLSLVGLGLVVVSVLIIYPFRRGIRIALIPAGACFFVFGVLGLLGQTLNLFNLLGAFLGVCLAHNYSIFSSESARAGAPPPAPVRLSALCATASFGVLACSRIPVVHSLGLTVALIVFTALSVIELEPAVRGGPD